MEYPEHEKLKAVSDKSQAIGDFIEWLGYKKNCELMKRLTRDELEDFEEDVGMVEEEAKNFLAFSLHESKEKLLAEFFNINLDKLEEEKQAMLAAIRKE